MDLAEKYGKVALVAGASEGLGAAFARGLAGRGFDLILVARRTELLKTTGDEIHRKYGSNVYPVTCDLSSVDAAEQIKQGVGSLDVNVLVYNAVSPYIGPFLSCPEDQQKRMDFVNVITVQKLVHHFGGLMVKNGKGGIVLMSSLAGFQGSGFLTAYAAAKAFARVFAEGLWYEWKKKGVDVIACCAGATSTPNYLNSRPRSLGFFSPKVQTPEAVVEECFQKLGSVPSFVSGRENRIAAFFMTRIFARRKAVMVMGDATRKIYDIEDS